MPIYDSYPWSELVPGAYVYDSQGEPWKLIDENPQIKGQFLGVKIDGTSAVLNDPGKPVRAAVPSHEQAIEHLERILDARRLEGQMTCEAMPTEGRGAAAHIRSHLRQMHGEYSEPSMKLDMLHAQHRNAHARGIYQIPHTHEGAPYG